MCVYLWLPQNSRFVPPSFQLIVPLFHFVMVSVGEMARVDWTLE